MRQPGGPFLIEAIQCLQTASKKPGPPRDSLQNPLWKLACLEAAISKERIVEAPLNPTGSFNNPVCLFRDRSKQTSAKAAFQTQSISGKIANLMLVRC